MLNIAYSKEKCKADFQELNETYSKALEIANNNGNLKLQVLHIYILKLFWHYLFVYCFILKLKVLNSLSDAEKTYHMDSSQTRAKIQNLIKNKPIELNEDDEESQESNENDDADSIVFSSDSK